MATLKHNNAFQQNNSKYYIETLLINMATTDDADSCILYKCNFDNAKRSNNNNDVLILVIQLETRAAFRTFFLRAASFG